MYFQINDAAYTIAEDGAQEPILRITNPEKLKHPEKLEALQKIANTIGELEQRSYSDSPRFQCGAEDFLSDLSDHKDHFVSLISHRDKRIGYLFAWRYKIFLHNIKKLLDDDLTLSQDEISELKEQVKDYLDKKGRINVIYISDTAVLPDFRRPQGVKTAPPIQELLGYFASWATPESEQTIFVHAETRVFSKNLADKFPNLFHKLSVTLLLDKEYFDSRGETMHTKIWRVTASKQQQSAGEES